MGSQVGWDPLKELMTVQKRMNKLFESAMARTDFESHDDVDSWSPTCDTYETDSELVLCLEVPGLEQDQIDLRLEADELIVSGERKIDRESAEHFHRVERSYGKFSRRFNLPSNVDRENVVASYRHGLLRVSLPKIGTQNTAPVRVTIR